jgi:hypothetical protein
MYCLENENKDTFHKNIYNNFYIRSPDQLIMQTYKNDGNKAIPPFQQKDLLYYGVKEGSELAAGALCNVNMNKTQISFLTELQFDNLFLSSEVLLMFVNTSINSIQTGFNLEKYVTADLKKRGFKHMLGSCRDNKYIIFKKLGYKIIKEVKSNNIKEFILMKDI